MTETPTVLIVDDEPSLREVYDLWLDDEYDVVTAPDGTTALDRLDESIDVVFLDRRMPGIDGDEVLSRIRGGDTDPYVVMVSAVTPSIDAIDLPFDDYLVKPVDGETLDRTISRCLAVSPETREEFAKRNKRSVLEASRPMAELEADDRYLELVADLETGRDLEDHAELRSLSEPSNRA